MQHFFDIHIATKYGMNEATFLNNLAFWILHNKANDRNFHDGRYWTYNTTKALIAIFPYWSIQNLRTVIKSCIDQDLIIVGNYNQRKNDRTLWYALSDLGLSLYPSIGKIDLKSIKDEDHLLKLTNAQPCGLQDSNNLQISAVEHLLESTNPFVRINTALPDRNTDNKKKKNAVAKSAPVDNSFSLPDWLPEETWEEFKQHRKEMKKPMSPLSEKKILRKLEKLMKNGNDLVEVLDNSMENGWTGVFPLKKSISNTTSIINKNEQKRNETGYASVTSQSNSYKEESEEEYRKRRKEENKIREEYFKREEIDQQRLRLKSINQEKIEKEKININKQKPMHIGDVFYKNP